MNTKEKEKLYSIEDLEKLLENIPYEIWLKDKDGKHVYINKKGADSLGLKKEDIIGKTDTELRSEGLGKTCSETDEQVIREKKPLFYEDEFEENDGGCYRVYKFPIKDSEDNVKLTGGIANEVTHSKHINKELKDLDNLFNEYQKSENENIDYTQSICRVLRNLNNMVKSTSIDLFYIDKEKERLDLYISYDKQSIFLEDSSINIDYEKFSRLYNNQLKICIDDELNYDFRKIYNSQVKMDDNSLFKIVPLKMDNELIGLMYIYYEDEEKCIDTYDGFIYDILHRIGNFITNIGLKNELKEKLYKSQEKANNLENEINKLEDVIESEMIKINFLENMSHEFRTPINVILMISKLLLSSIENDDFNLDKEKKINYLRTLRQNSYRILRLTTNILDSTRFVNDREPLEFNNYNIINIIEDIVLYSADYIKDKCNKTIIFDTEEEEVILSCNPYSIERIMLNLISNSLKFTDDYGIIEIDIKVNKEEERLYVHIKNNGEIISKEDKELIFSKFIQVENHIRRQNEGSGIGLYLVKCLVELHEGEIWVNSEVECGTEFVFYIPIKTINSEEDIKIYSIEQHSIIEKCNIEFSDIYM